MVFVLFICFFVGVLFEVFVCLFVCLVVCFVYSSHFDVYVVTKHCFTISMILLLTFHCFIKVSQPTSFALMGHASIQFFSLVKSYCLYLYIVFVWK